MLLMKFVFLLLLSKYYFIFSHPNVIKYKEAFFDEGNNSLCIVMEYANDGDLSSKITTHIDAGTHFPEEEIWQLLTQMCLGLEAMHKLNICHRDLKCANMFLSKGIVKIGDLNVSKVAKSGLLSTMTGSPFCISPEIWNNIPYNYKSDMWSLGCVLYELCALTPAFMADNIGSLKRKIISGTYEKLPDYYSLDLTKLIGSLLQLNPSLRPSCCIY